MRTDGQTDRYDEDYWRFSHLCEKRLNPLNAELNPICYLLALLGAHLILHVSSIRVKTVPRNLLLD